MATYKGSVTQGGADTFAASTITTGLTVDGKAGWEILGFKVFWNNGYTAAAQDQIANAVLATISTATSMSSEDEIVRISWSVANTAGVAVAYPQEPIQVANMLESRVTVQPTIYVHANTTTTGITNTFYYEIQYEVVKLTDLEVLRLYAGGA